MANETPQQKPAATTAQSQAQAQKPATQQAQVQKTTTTQTAQAQTQGQTVKKFYILERTNPVTKKLGFYFNEIGTKNPARGFLNFIDALKSFILVGRESKVPCVLYFHRLGSYRGFVTLEQASVILYKISKIKIDNTKIIAQLEANKLIQPLTANKYASDTTMAVAIQEFDLDEKAKDVKITVLSPLKKIDEIVMGDIRAELPGFTVEIAKILINDDKLDVYYAIKKDASKSSVFIKSLSGFGGKIQLSTARSIYEDMQMKSRSDNKLSAKFESKAWIFLSVLSVAAVITFILFVIIALKVFKMK